MNREWTGNKKSIFVTLGASNHSLGNRAENDYYATDPEAFKHLIDEGGVNLSDIVLEPCAGDGHLVKQIKEKGYKVVCKDIIQRNYKLDGIWDFLKQNSKWDGDIVMNPPYKYAKEFIEKSLEMIRPLDRVYAFLKLTFLESKSRRPLFETKQLKTVYVFSKRMKCVKNGDFEGYKDSSSAAAYAWFEFEKGYHKEPIIKWIN